MKYYGITLEDSKIELSKDCNCLPEIHTGPCWLHQDLIYQELNRSECLYPAQAIINSENPISHLQAIHASALLNLFGRKEMDRLKNKAIEMRRHGLKEIVKESN